jgi:hypothetical protein
MNRLIKDRFVLISRWQLDCTIEAAWQCIGDVHRWPQWWPNVRAVRTNDHTEQCEQCATPVTPRVGNAAWIDWKTRLGYGFRLRVVTTRVQPPHELEGIAEGDLIGHGLWVLEPQGIESNGRGGSGGVLITYRWDMHLNRPWMRMAAPLLRPVFAWNHFDVMHNGAHAMAKHLGCRLLHYQDYRFPFGAVDDLRTLPWHEPLVLRPSQDARGPRLD